MFSVFVLCTTVTILRDVFRILMEGISLAAPSDDESGEGYKDPPTLQHGEIFL